MFLVIVVIFPCSIVLYMRKGTKIDPHGAYFENYPSFYALLHDTVNLNQLLYMISACVEFRSMRISREDEKELNSMREYLSYMPKGKESSPQMIKVVFLLAARMENKQLSINFYNEQQKIVRSALKILKSIADAGLSLIHIQKSRRINLPTFELIADLSRCLVTGVPYPFEWINFVDGLKDYKPYKSLVTINQIKSKVFTKEWEKRVGAEEISKISAKLDEFPEYELKVTSDEAIYLGQQADFNIEFNRKLKVETKFDLNFVKDEYVWVLGILDKKVFLVKSIKANSNMKETVPVIVDKKLGFKTGDNSITFLLKSDSFIGVEALYTHNISVQGIKKTN